MKRASLTVDFSQITGKVKPMHGIGQPPRTGISTSLFHYLTRAGIPYSRLHDVGGSMGGGLYVDVPNLFRDFDADENDPASYDFAFTDKIIAGLFTAGTEPYFRLGVTIETAHMVKAYRIYPPKDFAKWARICEHIVAHYVDGWADGFRFPITYWEIWNEVDCCFKEETASMWKGTKEEYYRLYETAAKHLKGVFGDRIKIGGYAACGFYEYKKDENLDGNVPEPTTMFEFGTVFLHGFLSHLKSTGAPLDFFSWHLYDRALKGGIDFLETVEHADYIRRVLDRYGFEKTESHLNEWNVYYYAKRRDDPRGAVRTLAFMLMMQSTPTDLMCYYDAGLGPSDYRAFINPDTLTPYRTYYTFPMFNSLYRLGNAVRVESSEPLLFAGAAKNGSRASIVIANTTGEDLWLTLQADGFEYNEVAVHRIDEENRYTLTNERFGNINIPEDGCVEITLYRLA